MQSTKRFSRAAAYALRSLLAAMLLVSEGAANSEPLVAEEALVYSPASLPAENPRPVVTVFDNALLDRIFGKQRQRESVGPAEKLRESVGPAEKLREPVGPAENAPEAVVKTVPAPEPKLALLSPDEVFTVHLHSKMPAQQKALLRFAERGRYYLQAGDPARALSFFEKALGIGATQYLPYIYYYLAQSHFRQGNYHAAREFRVAAEAWLGAFPDWQVELARLEQQSLVG